MAKAQRKTVRVRRKPRVTSRRRKTGYRARKTTLKGGYCAPCVAPLFPVVTAAVGGAGVAMGSLFSMESTMKNTKTGSYRETVLRKASKKQGKAKTKSKTEQVVIKLIQKGRKSTLYKNQKKRKIKGNPVDHYNRLIRECKDKGFKKC